MGSSAASTNRVAIVRGDKATAFPLLQTVIARGGHSWPEICRKVDEQHAQIWLGVTDRPIAALVTQATLDDELECLIAGGSNARLWAGEAERVFTQFAREHGLRTLRIWGRRGWLRVFPHWTHMRDEDGLVVMETRI